MLTLLHRLPNRGKSVYALYRCHCGTKKAFRPSDLARNGTTDCGCQWEQKGLTAREPYTYKSYTAMVRRCQDENHPWFHAYGGRGISVYFDWLGPGGFVQFFKDMGRRPVGLSLDREQVNGNYEPGNCRWATPKMQTQNRRKKK